MFVSKMGVTPDTTILDVGGTSSFWEKMAIRPQVTLLNVFEDKASTFPQIVGSACSLPFEDGAFDIVFSNSMIEHLETWENQVLAAREIRRVGKRYWVQTPSRYFPIDPHFLTPFFHWLPSTLQRRFIRFTLWAVISKPTPDCCQTELRQIRLLDIRELRILFPDCRIITEKLFGMIKSCMAVY